MAKEIRKFNLTPGQQNPTTGKILPFPLKDGSTLWEGEEGTFPKNINSAPLIEDDLYEYGWRSDAYESALYGKPVVDEGYSELEKLKLQRIRALKAEARMWLRWEIGDYGDNITDAVRAIVLARCIEMGHETDPAIIEGFNEYCKAMYAGYGGGKAILETLISVAESFAKHIAQRYYVAKVQVKNAKDLNGIKNVELTKVKK